MITRLWRGWTRPDNAEAYEQFLLRELFPATLDVDHPRVATLRRPAPAQDMPSVLFGVVGLQMVEGRARREWMP